MNRDALRKAFADDPEIIRAIEADDAMQALEKLANKIPVAGIELIKGEDGETPIKGIDYFTPEEVAAFKEQVTPVKGKDYFDGEKGNPGTDADEKKIQKSILKTVLPLLPTAEEVAEKVPKPKNGKDGSPDTPDQIVGKLNTLEGALDPKVLKDTVITEKEFKKYKNNVYTKGEVDQRWHGGGLSSVSHDATLTGDGTPSDPLSVVGGGGATFYTETPAGAVNGVNTVYTVTHTIDAIMSFAINGAYIHPVDYSILGSTITFVTPIDASLSGLPFTIVYAGS